MCKKPFILTNLSLLLSKATLFHPPPPLSTALNLLSAKISHFYKPKAFYSHKPFLLPPKAILFCPPPPIRTTLNLLSAKNAAVLLQSALIPCAVKPESRTDSNHCRRYPTKLQLFANRLPDERRSLLQKHLVDRRFESSPESRGSQTSGVLLVLFVHAKRINSFPFREASRFRKPRISTPQRQLCTATIKTFQGSFEVLQPSNQHT